MTKSTSRRTWRSTPLLLAFLALALLVLPVAACGKRGSPGLPPGQTDQYPRQYPNPNEP